MHYTAVTPRVKGIFSMQADPWVLYEKLLSTLAGLLLGAGLSLPVCWCEELLMTKIQFLADNSLPAWDVPTWLGVMLFVGTTAGGCIGFTWWLSSIHSLLNTVNETVKSLQQDAEIRYRKLRRRARKHSDIVRDLKAELMQVRGVVAHLQHTVGIVPHEPRDYQQLPLDFQEPPKDHKPGL